MSLPPIVCSLIYVICVCLRIVVSYTYCVVFVRFSLTVVNALKPGGLHLQSILSTDIMENKR
jgi:hypothetical protein